MRIEIDTDKKTIRFVEINDSTLPNIIRQLQEINPDLIKYNVVGLPSIIHTAYSTSGTYFTPNNIPSIK